MNTEDATSQKSIPTLYEQIGTTERELRELEVEKETLPGLIQAAAREADADRLVVHRRRGDEIGYFIHAAQVRLARLRLAAAETELPEAEAETKRLSEDAARAQAKLDEARSAWSLAQGAFECAHAQAYDIRLAIAEHKRRLDQLMATVQGSHAPVVRSLPHAARSAA